MRARPRAIRRSAARAERSTGRCQPQVAATNAIQHTSGCVSHAKSRRTASDRSSGPMTALAIRGGSARTIAIAGAAREQHRRRDNHQQQMLRHVNLQQYVVERLERRGDCDEERGYPAHEHCEPPQRKALRHLAMQAMEAARVDRGGDEQRRDGGERRRPRIQRGLYCGVHSDAGTAGRAESRAGGSPGGCIVARNATIALTSAGVRFLP